MRQPTHLALALIIWLGFGLRLFRLYAKNLWWDEALAIWAVRKGIVGATVWTAGDVHPPLFFWTLWGWVQLAGESEFATRFLSAGWGLLTVLLTYRLARRLFNKSVALMAASLLATARFHIWWSQELRMYVGTACCVALSLEFFTRLYARDLRRRTWLGYIISTGAALYTLYLAGLVLAVQNGFLILTAPARHHGREFWLRWVGAQLAVLLLLVPWLSLALGRMRTWSVSKPFDLALFAELYGLLLSTGISTQVARYRPLTLGVGALTLVGMGALWRQKSRGGGWQGWERSLLLLLLLVLPPLAVYALTLPRGLFYSPRVEARYLVTFAPSYYVLLAGVITLAYHKWRWTGTALAVAAFLTSGWALRDYYRTRYVQDEFQSAVRIIGAYARPDDAVLLVSGNRYPIFRYYYEQLVPPERRPKLYELPRYAYEITPDNVGRELGSAIGDHARVWLMLAESHLQDPQGASERWMRAHYVSLLSQSFYHNQLILYTDRPETIGVAKANPQHPLEASVAGNVLLGYDLPTVEYRPGDTIHLGLYWQESTSLPVAVDLVDGGGRMVSRHVLAGQGDSQVQRRDVGFSVLPFTPGGRYHFRLLESLEGSSTAAPLTFGSVTVRGTRALPPAGSPTHTVDARLGDAIRLVGYDVAPPRAVKAGREVSFDLYWEATEIISSDYTVFVHLLGPFNPGTGGPVWAQHDGRPLDGQYPTNHWLPGPIIRDRHTVSLPLDMPPGPYEVEVGLYVLATGDRPPVTHPDGTQDTRVLLESVQVVR